MKVRYKIGDVVKRECTFDSTYMLVEMRRVGVVMRLRFHWVHRNVILYIVLDNSGGHRPDLHVAQYTAILRNDFNIMLIHQVPCSP